MAAVQQCSSIPEKFLLHGGGVNSFSTQPASSEVTWLQQVFTERQEYTRIHTAHKVVRHIKQPQESHSSDPPGVNYAFIPVSKQIVNSLGPYRSSDSNALSSVLSQTLCHCSAVWLVLSLTPHSSMLIGLKQPFNSRQGSCTHSPCCVKQND